MPSRRQRNRLESALRRATADADALARNVIASEDRNWLALNDRGGEALGRWWWRAEEKMNTREERAGNRLCSRVGGYGSGV